MAIPCDNCCLTDSTGSLSRHHYAAVSFASRCVSRRVRGRLCPPLNLPLRGEGYGVLHERGLGLGAMIRVVVVGVLGGSGDPEQIRTADLLLDREAC